MHVTAAHCVRIHTRLTIIKRSKISRSRSQLVFIIIFCVRNAYMCVCACWCMNCMRIPWLCWSVCLHMHAVHFIPLHMRRFSFSLVFFLSSFFAYSLSLRFYLHSQNSLLGSQAKGSTRNYSYSTFLSITLPRLFSSFECKLLFFSANEREYLLFSCFSFTHSKHKNWILNGFSKKPATIQLQSHLRCAINRTKDERGSLVFIYTMLEMGPNANSLKQISLCARLVWISLPRDRQNE